MILLHDVDRRETYSNQWRYPWEEFVWSLTTSDTALLLDESSWLFQTHVSISASFKFYFRNKFIVFVNLRQFKSCSLWSYSWSCSYDESVWSLCPSHNIHLDVPYMDVQLHIDPSLPDQWHVHHLVTTLQRWTLHSRLLLMRDRLLLLLWRWIVSCQERRSPNPILIYSNGKSWRSWINTL